jgi:hypothetical protein
MVRYANVIPGKSYRVVGKIYDTETGEPVIISDRQELVEHVTFVLMTSSGQIPLKFDATKLVGYKYSVGTELYFTSARYDTMTASTVDVPVKIVEHNKDLADKEESFFVPAVSTSAYDYYTNTNVTLADTMTDIVDIITFSGVSTTDKYVTEGVIMDTDTMEPLLLPGMGGPVTATMGEFTVKESSNGTGYGKKIRFTFSTNDLEGKTFIIFERLFLVKGRDKMLFWTAYGNV